MSDSKNSSVQNTSTLPNVQTITSATITSKDHINQPVRETGTNVVFRIPLDNYIDPATLYVSMPMYNQAGNARAPLFAGAEGLIERSTLKIAGSTLTESVGHGRRTTQMKALTRTANRYTSNAALMGYGGATVQINTDTDVAPDRVATNLSDGNVVFNSGSGLDAARTYGRLENLVPPLSAQPQTLGLGVPPTVLPWDDSAGYAFNTTQSSDTMDAGYIHLSNVHPELGNLPVLPRIPGGFLELNMSINPKLSSDFNHRNDTAEIYLSGTSLCYTTLELEDEVSKKVDEVYFSGNLNIPYLVWLQSTAVLPAKTASADIQSIPLGFRDELVSSVLIANHDSAALTNAEKPILRNARALAFQERARINLQVAGNMLMDMPADNAGMHAANLAEALDVADISPAPGTYERQLDLITGERKGQVVYTAATLTTNKSIPEQTALQVAPLGFSLKAIPYLPRTPENCMPTGADGLRLRIERPAGGTPAQQAAGTLYSWALCSRLMRFTKSENPKNGLGLVVRVDRFI